MLEDIKNVSKITAQVKPPKPKIIPPERAAASAPLALSAFMRQASRAINVPNKNPRISCICLPLASVVDNCEKPVDKQLFSGDKSPAGVKNEEYRETE